MEIFRLTRKKYKNILSGKGAAHMGGRWNSPGTEIVYCASNRSLAMAEVAVHLSFAMLPKDFYMLTIYVPDDTPMQILHSDDLPEHWNLFPPIKSTQELGDRFVTDGKFCLLKIPSVVTKGDTNVLINPHHPKFSSIEILNAETIPFDQRLLYGS